MLIVPRVCPSHLAMTSGCTPASRNSVAAECCVRGYVRLWLAAFEWLASLPGKVGGWFRRVKDSAVDKLKGLLTWVRGLPGRLLDALGDLVHSAAKTAPPV